jgi:hypothetical protein
MEVCRLPVALGKTFAEAHIYSAKSSLPRAFRQALNKHFTKCSVDSQQKKRHEDGADGDIIFFVAKKETRGQSRRWHHFCRVLEQRSTRKN